MRKDLQIINIDGTEGVGKTTQSTMLANKLRQLGHKVIVNHLDDNIESAKKCTDSTWKFLKENSEGIVINDGSVARMMVVELLRGVAQSKVIEKYRDVIHEHEYLNHEFGLANLLIIMQDVEECHKRILKRASFTKNPTNGIEDQLVEFYIVNGLRKFDDNIISNSLKFHVLETYPEDSILDVQKDLLEYLEFNFQIKKITSS